MTSEITTLPDQRRMNWPTTIVLAILHAGAIGAFFCFSWINLAACIFLYCLTLGFGISMGYHRLHTHRSYKTWRGLEYFFAICGALSLEGGPIFWVATHRIHHQKSDQHGDPHSPNDGAWWAHVGWILLGQANHNNTQRMGKYAPDLMKDPFYIWLNNYHWLPMVVTSILLWSLGGFSMFLWGTCLRITLGLHSTWLVNSATHMWGRRRFNTRDDSRNNWWVALLTFGEGWHNNHHAHPTSARHGLAWYEFDPSWLLIRTLNRLGIIRSLHVARLDEEVNEQKAA